MTKVTVVEAIALANAIAELKGKKIDLPKVAYFVIGFGDSVNRIYIEKLITFIYSIMYDDTDNSLFYYLNEETGSVALVDGFKNALNNGEDYIVDGDIVWKFGDNIPTQKESVWTNYDNTFADITTDYLNFSQWSSVRIETSVGMFKNSTIKELDLGRVNIKNSNMSSMFEGCLKLESVIFPVGEYTTTSIDNLFSGCSSLTEINFFNMNFSNSDLTANNSFVGCDLVVNSYAYNKQQAEFFDASLNKPENVVFVPYFPYSFEIIDGDLYVNQELNTDATFEIVDGDLYVSYDGVPRTKLEIDENGNMIGEYI